jgi:hypothetical protein
VVDVTPALTIWLAFVAAIGIIAYFGTRGQAIAFALVAAMTLPASFHALGRAAPWQPAPGEYTVLGARIDVPGGGSAGAIFVLLNGNPEPRYYRLAYSQQAANDLQAALDAILDGDGAVIMQMGESGAIGFSEDAPPPESEKVVDVPLIQ